MEQKADHNLLRLGTGNPNQSGLHRPDFDIDEGAIACGIETLSTLALGFISVNFIYFASLWQHLSYL